MAPQPAFCAAWRRSQEMAHQKAPTDAMPLETEVKFFVPDHEVVREVLRAAGAVLGTPRRYERNVVYDTTDGRLERGGRLLRLRQDDRVRLTFKGSAAEDAAAEARIREEIEVHVSDFAAMDAILQKIGFEPRQVYEKYRETWHLGEVEAVLDTLPYGHFVELEGPEEAIKAAAGRLGLDWSKRIRDTYLELMAQLKALYGLRFDDITFERFAGLNIDGAGLWS